MPSRRSAAPPKLTWASAAAWRAARHYLTDRAPRPGPVQIASRICGLHAQVLSCAELALWARNEGFKQGRLAHALWEKRTLLKTWAMRGTLHLLPAKEFAHWRAVLSLSRRYASPVRWMKYVGITLEQLDSLTEAAGAALRGTILTREELMESMSSRTGLSIAAAASSWGVIFKPAAFTGHLCFAPSVGQRVRFTHPETWIELPAEQPTSEAGAWLARRYLAAYGPATNQDFARWWGGGATQPRQWMAALGEEVTQVDLEGTPAWMLAADIRAAAEAPPTRSVRLLPGFDPYVVAASYHARALLPGDFRTRVYRPQGWISPVLLVNGFMQGVWRHELKGVSLEVVIEPFVKLPAWVRRAATEEAERLAGFFGGRISLRFAPAP
jgi:hypothetical protein